MEETARSVAILVAVIGMSGTVIGGILGFVGGLITQLTLEKRKQEYERQKEQRQQEYEKQQETRRKKAEKLEELISTLYEHNHWLHTQYRFMAQGSHDKLLVTPFSKIEAIKQLYFPEFAPLVAKLGHATYEYEKWLIDNAQSIGSLKLPADLAEQRMQLYRTYLGCNTSLLDEIS